MNEDTQSCQEEFGLRLKSGIIARVLEKILEKMIKKKTNVEVSLYISELHISTTDGWSSFHADISGVISNENVIKLIKGGK